MMPLMKAEKSMQRIIADDIFKIIYRMANGKYLKYRSASNVVLSNLKTINSVYLFYRLSTANHYTQLGSGQTIHEITALLKIRSGFYASQVRIERIVETEKEGKSKEGCPVAKCVIRRSGNSEKLLALVKHRKGHNCKLAYIVVAIVVWDGISGAFADQLYNLIVYKTAHFGLTTDRRCALNERRTCACQGVDPRTMGSCFSFGCSWSMFYNGCKFKRSNEIRKFRLSKQAEYAMNLQETELEQGLQTLATVIAPVYAAIAPEAFENQTSTNTVSSECRIGHTYTQPFSGVTACLDFCAHNHKDIHNIKTGCTVVVTLINKCAKEEQLHVLSKYTIDSVNSYDLDHGTVKILRKFPQRKRMRSSPLDSCRKRNRSRKLIDKKSVEAVKKILFRGPIVAENEYSSIMKLVDSPLKNLSSFSTTSKPVTRHIISEQSSKEVIYEFDSDNEDYINDSSMGGVAIALSHGSLLFECARHEIHSTTSLSNPNRRNPSRISLVFYQHRNLDKSKHGKFESVKKLGLAKI
ncbi:Methylcytosine dioxygenase TET1-like protein [Leptotrombidium deliense]|uniref:Methylcytosine dioxygenase TET n=1 Tax=Leptotrombidium deliense TaxID=299467 RepID=A0A443SSM4_9ACAR|nr:Methylcytosine dioxygenase TET1-like protein [Leptotrombidium deliense]